MIGTTMNKQERGLEKAMKADEQRQQAQQRMSSNTSGLKPINRVREGVQHVGLDARLQCYGTSYTPQQIEQIYTHPPQQ